jgi:hypothetical protein
MGLDMYAWVVDKNDHNQDFSISEDVEKEELAYWRKFNALHGWMQNLYYEKGGPADSFNCIPVRLTKDDLMRLQADAMDKRLTPTPGFFFGDQTIYPEDIESTLEFVGKALAAITNGKEVYYDSWW